MFASSASAFDPDDLHKLKDTGDCVQCDLKDANLVRANLKGADLSYSNLEGAILKDAWLEGANCRWPLSTQTMSGCFQGTLRKTVAMLLTQAMP